MTFQKLLRNHFWANISPIFLEIYPEAKRNIDGLKNVFEKLMVMDSEGIEMSIVLTKEIDEEEEYIEVSGLYNNPKNEEEKYLQGIEFISWNKWLGMDICEESLDNFSEQEIISHCLYEMTFYGFSEKNIEKFLNE